MLNVHQLSIAFQGENLFDNVSFRLQSGNRIGLIGKNGAGKSTIMKIIYGIKSLDEGAMGRTRYFYRLLGTGN